MGFKTTNLKSWSVQKYVVAVLWMEGRLATNEIARQVRWTGGQVRGFYTQEFRPARINMTIVERQAALDELRRMREWFGIFVNGKFDDRFRAKEIESVRVARERQEARARADEVRRMRKEAEERGERPPKLSKKEQRKLELKAAHRSRQEAREAAERELGFAPRGRDTDALEWLSMHALGDKGESLGGGALSSRDRRKEALLKFRMYLEGASISPLRAQDYEAARGAGRRVALPEFRKHCIDMLGAARKVLSGELYRALEAVVMEDEFIWRSADSTKKKSLVYEGIRYGADLLATFYQIISPQEFRARWAIDAPLVDVPTRSQARADSRRAQEIIDELTRKLA
jgi:hypothetical protein